MRIVINPKYEYLADFVRKIPDETYEWDVLYKNDRNTVKKVTVNGTTLVVKRYKRPTLANCFIYTFFKMNKAKRSYVYGFRLKEMGFNTAEPVAYIEISRNGFFHTGYFVSAFLPYPLLKEVENYQGALKSEVLSDFAEFTIRQHEAGILNNDYNLTNVFFHKEEERWEFALIDTNRIVFRRKLSRGGIIRQMQSISASINTITEIAEHYAVQRGWNADLFCGVLLLRRGMAVMGKIKRFFKNRLVEIKGVLQVTS
ncbi:MAG: tyrosine protein kinase [Bacteroidales bacterium]|jgi:hypothetical protein|nr:tyrosine protein kinase [Bacteroidales bacterium]